MGPKKKGGEKSMKRLFACLFALSLVLGGAALAVAGSTATQTVSYSTQAISEISVSGNPGALVVNAATAGQNPDEATDSATAYAVTTNQSNKKITGAIDSDMPADTTLKINLVAPTGGTSQGDVALSTAAANLVTGISLLAESDKMITYRFSALPSAGVITGSRTVTLTLIDG
jgi:hypothetical protein